METLKKGDLAYFDSFAGLVPVKVLSIRGKNGFATSSVSVTVKVTAARKAYARGEVFETSALWVAPRKCVTIRKYGSTITNYKVECEELA